MDMSPVHGWFVRSLLTLMCVSWGCDEDAVGESPPSDSALLMEDMSTAQVDGAIDPDPSDAAVPVIPRITEVRIRPEDPTVTDALECEWDFVHPEAGEDQSTVQWFVGEMPLDTGTTLASGFARGDIIRCEVTPMSDGLMGEPASQAVTILNSAPTIDSVTLTPDMAFEATVLTCTPGPMADADPTDTPLAIISWEVNGASIDASENTLSGADFGRGDEVVCIATPTDGDLSGEARRSDAVMIGNTAPSVSEVRFMPEMPRARDAVTCSYEFVAADGDVDTSTVRWTLNGEPAGDTATFDGDAVEGDVLTCTVIPSDGTDASAPVTAEITVENTLPSIGTVTILPLRDTFTDEAITCEAQDVRDPDTHQELTYAYTWHVNDEPVPDADESRLSETVFSRGDRVVCTVTVSDSFGESEPTRSDPKIIANKPPSQASVTSTPLRPSE